MHRELVPRIGETTHDDSLQDRQPVRPLTARRKPRLPEAIEPEPVPQLRAGPDLAPVLRVPHRQTVHADAHDLPVVRLGRAVLGEQLQLAHLAVIALRWNTRRPTRTFSTMLQYRWTLPSLNLFVARRNMPVLSHIRPGFPRGQFFTTQLFAVTAG